MNDQQGWINTLFAAVVTMVAFMLNLYRRKVDKIEEQHRELITREEFQHQMAILRDDRMRLHEENVDRLQGLGSDIRAVHMRIDQVFKGK